MADNDKRTEAMQRVAEFRERAEKYNSLAIEAQRRGDVQMSIEFERRAAEELTEASRIENGLGKPAE